MLAAIYLFDCEYKLESLPLEAPTLKILSVKTLHKKSPIPETVDIYPRKRERNHLGTPEIYVDEYKDIEIEKKTSLDYQELAKIDTTSRTKLD
ncbi:44710_t:CDS:2 [Gigaspora margarita]|uniref:44710_t:CDS:1 n=1 Tax=Gigaspora margarita TaxID=4874 RepID=A0ABN7VX84_GIGMA|nr:44710_t:CDS:2 [Gigaspora margarita]